MRRRVEVLRAPPAGEAVGRDDDRLAHRAAADQAIEPLAEPRLPGVPRKQHLAGAGVAGQPVDDRIASRRLARVRRRQPDGDPARRRVTEGISDERAALDRFDHDRHRAVSVS